MDIRQTVRFTIIGEVDQSHEAYDDPESAADAAAGVLSNVSGTPCIYTDIDLVSEP